MPKKFAQCQLSLIVNAAYLFINGIGFLFIPNYMLTLLYAPETQEVYIRIIGMMIIILSIYYFDAAKANSISFMRRSIQLRMAAAIILFIFAYFNLGPKALYLFSALDFAGALWTRHALPKN